METISAANPQNIYSNLSGNNSVERAIQLSNIAGISDAKDQLKAVTSQFESILLRQMMSAMRATVPRSGFLDSFSLQMYESMLDEEIANVVAKERGIGLSEMLYDQLSRMVPDKTI